MKARFLLRHVCEIDIYSSRVKTIVSPTREHIVPCKYLSSFQKNDLNNIFVCTSTINAVRGAMPFIDLNMTDTSNKYYDGAMGWLYDDHVLSSPDLCTQSKLGFTPPLHSRGAIARSCMYMIEQYPSLGPIISTNVMTYHTMMMWNALYPVQDWEKRRSRRIALLGYPLNPFT